MNLIQNFHDWRAYRAAVSELDSLSNRQLADLGIARHQIKTVARTGRR